MPLVKKRQMAKSMYEAAHVRQVFRQEGGEGGEGRDTWRESPFPD